MKKLLFFVCAIFAFVACTQAPIEEQQGIEIDTPEILTVGFEDGDQTRIQLNEMQKTVWNKSDLVSVFYRSDANQKWQYQGESGERVGNLKRVENATSTTKTTKTIVVYPYSESYWLNTDSYAIEATLPATQHYTAGSYGIGSNLMVSQSEFTQFSLKSVCGWLKLQLTGDGAVVKSIKFRGNNEEQVAGLIYVDTATAEATLASDMGGTDDNNAGGNLVFDDTILTELTLDCGEGVTLDEEVTTFYLSLPPQTFTNGFTVDIECVDNEPFTLSTTNELIIERNTIQPMAAVEVEHEPIEVKPANNEIWYTNGSTTEATTPYSTDAFGVNIVSNTYDAEKECWVIKFNGEVTTIGSHAFWICSTITSVTIPESVTTIGDSAFESCTSLTSVTIPDSVTTIRGNAFDYCKSLTSVTIPNSVTYIGYSAFESCTSLTSVTIGNGVTTIDTEAFSYCRGLTSVTIPDSVTTIGTYAFASCDSLTSVTIGNGVTTIGEFAFHSCSSLTSVNIPDSVTTIGKFAFKGCTSLTSVTIPDSVTTIGDNAFSACSSLTSVTIPNSVTTIGGFAFTSCSMLQEFKGNLASEDGRCLIIKGTLIAFAPAELTEYAILDSVTTIGLGAFSSCSGLTSVNIPNGVTTIGDSAFQSCSSLTSVNIPDSVTTIGEFAFKGCTSLTSVTIPDSVTTIDTEAFRDCSSLTSITIPDSVTSIGYDAFHSCTSLTSVTIPDSVTYIGGLAFQSCTSLTSVTIPDSVTKIGNCAFAYCSRLTSVTIPDSVTTIGNGAFKYCSSLTSVYCEATTPPTGYYYMFDENASDRKIYVPRNSVEAYKSAEYWSEYAYDIVGYDF